MSVAKRKPGPRTATARRRAAKALANGGTNAEAGAAAGHKGKRAKLGITVAEWKRDPDFRALVEKYAEEAMSGTEWEARNALMARGQLPSRYQWDGEGHLIEAVCDSDKAMDRQGKALGKFKDGSDLPSLPGSALGVFLTVEPAKLAALAEAAAEVLRAEKANE